MRKLSLSTSTFAKCVDVDRAIFKYRIESYLVLRSVIGLKISRQLFNQ